MSKNSKKPAMTLTEAVENLSSMAEIDSNQLEIEREALKRGDADLVQRREWLDLSNEEKTYDAVKESFKTIHNYLKKVYTATEVQGMAHETKKGLHAIMELAGEAAEKIKTCSNLFQEAHRGEEIAQLKEYQDLKKFYLNKIVKKFQKEIESEEAWQEEWGGYLPQDTLDIERRGLRELEQVKKDRGYELFYITNEDGKPFYNQNLLRHIRLVGNFDEMILNEFEDDPFIKIRSLLDKGAQERCEKLKESCKLEIQGHFRDALKFKNLKVVAMTSLATFALMLGRHTRNLIQHSTGKGCVGYLKDFLFYVREFFSSIDVFQNWRKKREEIDSQFIAAFDLVHSYCFQLFTQVEKRDATIGFIYALIQKSGHLKELPKQTGDSLALWNSLLDFHEALSQVLRKYPNGPLIHLLTLFDKQESERLFDPFKLRNYPSNLFRVHSDRLNVHCLRIPSPTQQKEINKASVIPEFQAFIESLVESEELGSLLMFNLQDRTSWEEHARSEALEQFQHATKALTVVTLSKNTDFYHQASDYIALDDPDEFMSQLITQIHSGEECGFYFPETLDSKELDEFTQKSVHWVYQNIFREKEVLTRRERLDFIEITYWLLILKIVQMVEPRYLSFTCKDAIDTGQMQSVALFAFLKIIFQKGEWSAEESDFLLWMAFGPALLIRNRPVDSHRLSRTLSALTILAIEAENPKVVKTLPSLYKKGLFSNIRVEESKE